MNLTTKNKATNYNKTPYIDIGRRNNTMTPEAIRETLISLGRNLGGKKLSKATVYFPSFGPDCMFEIDKARLVRRLSKLLIMDDGNEVVALSIPSSDIKSLHHNQYGKNHFISIRHQDDSCTNVDLWVA